MGTRVKPIGPNLVAQAYKGQRLSRSEAMSKAVTTMGNLLWLLEKSPVTGAKLTEEWIDTLEGSGTAKASDTSIALLDLESEIGKAVARCAVG